MIHNEIIQADIVAKLKADETITAALVRQDGEGGAESVKEDQYQGTTFIYPAIRVKLQRQIPIKNRGPCDHARLTFSILCLTEGGSSKAADHLAGLVNDLFHGPNGSKNFKGTGWNSYFRSTGLDDAIRTGEKLWLAVANFDGVIYPA